MSDPQTLPTAPPTDISGTPRSETAPALAPGPTPGQPGNVPAPVHARKSVAEFGGQPGGRPSKFKFPAGTERGDAERRKADADRVAKKRAEDKKLVVPPTLPSASASAPGPMPSPNGDQTPIAPVEVGRPVVPWTPDMLQELTDGIVDALEERRVEKFIGKANEAKLPEKLVKEIGADARYPVVGKKGLKVSLPQVGAKLANKTGLSAEHLPEIILAKAITVTFFQGKRLEAKLDKLIEQEKARQKELAKTAVVL